MILLAARSLQMVKTVALRNGYGRVSTGQGMRTELPGGMNSWLACKMDRNPNARVSRGSNLPIPSWRIAFTNRLGCIGNEWRG